MKKTLKKSKKTIRLAPNKISYTGIVDFRYAAKIATPGVVNIKCTFKSQPQQFENRDDNEFYNLPAPLQEFFKNHPLFRQYEFAAHCWQCFRSNSYY